MDSRLMRAVLCAAIVVLMAGPAMASSVGLSWTPPTTNEDGTPLLDLAGYTVYGGTQPGQYSRSWSVSDASAVATAVTFTATEGERWYFVITASDFSGNESAYSNEVNQYFPTSEDLNVPAVPGALTITDAEL